jgi:hypothetical protein
MKFKYDFSEQEITFSFLWGDAQIIARADMDEISYGQNQWWGTYDMDEIVCYKAYRNGKEINDEYGNLGNLSRHLTHILKEGTEKKEWVEFFTDCVDKFFEKMYGQ